MPVHSATPTTTAELASIVSSSERVVPIGGGSKPGLLSGCADCVQVSTSGLRGIVDYVPSEFTLTARAGTPLQEIVELLEAQRQHLPFDPLFVAAGATLGGTMAAGASGPGSLRYGGLRDFVLGVLLVDGEGRGQRSGGRVVKNAAGFDVPKLMVGSAGALGVLVEITVKVFPRAERRRTLGVPVADLEEGLEKLRLLRSGKWDVEAADLDADGRLLVRVAGGEASSAALLERLRAVLGGGDEAEPGTARDLWELGAWCGGRALVKVPTSLSSIAALDALAARLDAGRRYSLAGEVAWLAVAEERLGEVDRGLLDSASRGLLVRGRGKSAWLGGPSPAAPFLERVKGAFDPRQRFRPLS